MNMIAIIPAAVVIPFAGWRLYSRYRNSMGRQQCNPRKSWASVVFFPLLFLFLVSLSFRDTASFASLLVGAAAGISLGIVGLRLTTFDACGETLAYRQNPYLDTALLTILAIRISYRFFLLFSQGLPDDQEGTIIISPIGLAILGAVIWYYAFYSAGILFRRSKLRSR